MEKTPAYYRARLEVFNQLISEEAQSYPSKDSPDLRVLRNGVLPGRLQATFDHGITKYMKDKRDNVLSFDEITQFNTWFEIHPEKIAGNEIITSSREFPIKIKGTEEDIIRTVTPANLPDTNNNKDKRIRMAKARAIARKRSLKLLKI